MILKVILTDEHGVTVRRWEENLSAGQISKEFELDDLNGGWYKIQAYSYAGDKLVAVSYPQEFFVQERSVLSTLSNFKDTFINSPLIAPVFYSLSMLIIFVALILYLSRRIQKRRHQHVLGG